MRTINSKVSLALLVIFSMAIFACQSEKQETKSAKEVATGFLDKMTAGDIAGAKEYSTSASAQALDMMADMGDTWEGMSYEIVEVNKVDSTATVQYKLDGEDHMLDMTMEDDQWKVEYAFMMPGEGDMMEEDMGDVNDTKTGDQKEIQKSDNDEKLMKEEKKEMDDGGSSMNKKDNKIQRKEGEEIGGGGN